MKRIRQGMRVDPATLRVRLVELARASVDACSARAPEGDESPPLVLCARHKALAVDAELGALAANEEAVLTQLEATRDVEIAAGRPADEVAAGFAARVSEVYAAAAAKRVALETAAVTADAALENALAVVAALTEAATSLNDDELAARAPALLSQEAAVRATVASIPASPAVSGFLGLRATKRQAADPGAAFGRVLDAPMLSLHVHTPHCEPACSLRIVPHVHSAGCNHAPAPRGAVWEAADRGDVAALEAALVAGGSTEEADQFGMTALFCVARSGHVGAASLLVMMGAVASAKSPRGTTPLHIAAQLGYVPIVHLLLADPSVDPTAEDIGWTPLFEAAQGGHAAVVGLLLSDPRVDPTASDSRHNTPLHVAAFRGRAPVVSVLLADTRVNPNARGQDGKTPLLHAAEAGHAPVVLALLANARVDRSARDTGGHTALDLAKAAGKAHVVAILTAQQCPSGVGVGGNFSITLSDGGYL